VSVRSSTRSEISELRTARLASWGRVNPYRLRAVVRHAGTSVLDVGCSAGGYVEALAARGYQVYGLDLLAGDQWRQGSRRGYIVGDSLALAFCDRAFDTVIAFEVLEHVHDPCLALTEFHRVCRQNIILTVPDCETPHELLRGGLTYAHWRDRTHHSFFTEDSLAELVRQSGFRLMSLGRINPCLIDYPILHSLHVPPRLAYLMARALRRIPFRTQYLMTLLAVADKV